jgi:hypothetical protein
MHALLVGKGLLPRMEVQPGYRAMLRLAVSKPEGGPEGDPKGNKA